MPPRIDRPVSLAAVHGFTLRGIEAMPVEVRATSSPGLPSFRITGLSDAKAGGARDRVRTALAAMGLSLPSARVVVDLSPADPLVDGRHHDLPIALALLGAMGVLSVEDLSGYAAMGGLSPDGSLVPVPGVLSAAIGASALEVGLVCPEAQGGEAAWAGAIEVLAAPDLLAIINHFRGTQVLTPPCIPGWDIPPHGPRLAEVPVGDGAKRALEAAADHGRPLALIGPPGPCAALAACLPGLLPDLDARGALETSLVHGASSPLEGGRLVRRPPFRVATAATPLAALMGGGGSARPGEVGLAHNGVLFLDGLGGFGRDAVAGLARVIATGRAAVARGAVHVEYPARFRLVVAVEPLPAATPVGTVPTGDGIAADRTLRSLGDLPFHVVDVRPA